MHCDVDELDPRWTGATSLAKMPHTADGSMTGHLAKMDNVPDGSVAGCSVIDTP